MKKCRHKRLILISTNNVCFEVDEEPYKANKIECAGITEVMLITGITAHYCPICEVIVDINIEPNQAIETEPCDCEKHRRQNE
jgi:hypothetical protein